MQSLRVLPASGFSLEALAELYTRTFGSYFYEALVTPQQMAQFVRTEQLDLGRSPVLAVGDELVGLATLGLRGERAYCKGFGIVVPFRGRGLAHALCAAMLEQARQAGARRLGLGVLQKNEGAVKTYLRAGLRVWRELLSFEWTTEAPSPRRGEGGGGSSSSPARGGGREGASWRGLAYRKAPPPPPPRTRGRQPSTPAQNAGQAAPREREFNVEPIAPARALECFAEMHPAPPVWDRDLPTLCLLDDLQGLALMMGERIDAYVLYQASGEGAIELQDLAGAGARQSPSRPDGRDAVPLLKALQQRHARICCSNEPAESPAVAAFVAAGFRETWRRYEMTIEFD